MKISTLLFCLVLAPLFLLAQLRLDVVGDAQIIGKLSLVDTVGGSNVFIGEGSGINTVTGYRNTASGVKALFSNTTGDNNTASGHLALFSNTEGSGNTADGYLALYFNTEGFGNTASGYQALYINTTGNSNTAIGRAALNFNKTGSRNTASGANALFSNSSGYNNIASGYEALQSNTSGYNNTANGTIALHSNTQGNYRTALGYSANSVGSFYDNNTGLGYDADCTASNQVRIGNNSVSSIGGFQAWTNTSDERFKKQVKENVVGLEFILKLRPVTYQFDLQTHTAFMEKHYSIKDTSKWEGKYEIEKIVQTGFIAQEVEAAAKSLGYDFSGVDAPKNDKDYYGLRYSLFTVPLVKAVQEHQAVINQQQRTIEKQELNVQQQQREIFSLQTELEALKAEVATLRAFIQQITIPKNSEVITPGRLHQDVRLEQNQPNPFSENTYIRYYIPGNIKNAELHITNMKGEILKKIIITNYGVGQIEIKGHSLSAGMYLYTLFLDGIKHETKKMILINSK